MKPSRLLPALALLLPVLPAAVAPAPPGASAGPPAAAAQDRNAEFREKFQKAMEIGSWDEMERLMRTYQREAVMRIVVLSESISQGPTEKAEKEMEALRKAWKGAYGTDFAKNVYEYFSLLPSHLKDARRPVKVEYDKTNAEFHAAEAAGDGAKLAGLGMRMESLGASFEEVGDLFHASEAWLIAGRAFDEPLRGEDADLGRAWKAYARSVALREELGLEDVFYAQTKERADALERLGHGDPAKAAPGAAGAAAPVEAGAAVPLAVAFEPVPEIASVRRPVWAGDEVYAAWPSLNLRGSGSSARFPAMPDSPSVLRSGAAEVAVDVDGDGEGDAEIPLTGNLELVQLELGQGDEQRTWAFLAAVGAERDTYNGVQFNLAPSDQYMTIYIAPAASVTTEIGGVPVRVLDDNMDGRFGGAPISWNQVGMLEGSFQQDLDSLVVGDSDRAVPWSEFVQVGDAWYKLSAGEKPTEITAAPVEGLETGTLKVSFKGVDPDWLLVKGAKGKLENAYFDVAASRKGVEVPAGRYELFLGQVSKGKKQQMAKALVVPTDRTPTWTVEPGGTTEIELGGPFGFVFDVDQDDSTVTVRGKTVAVVGAAGETYQRLWNCVVRPEVSVREKGRKRGGKPEDMEGPQTQEEISEVGFEYAWFPMDLSLPKDEGEVEVQLVEKKNKLFGKIESDWRE